MQRNKVYEYYNEHAKNCAPEDFWGQVKRSINGQVVGQDQIDLIIAAIVDGLALEPDDVVLDLCCGNGVLSDEIFQQCRGGVGVDFAEYLIDVAHEHFEKPGRTYVLDDVEHYLRNTTDASRFTKVLCYSSFQYFSPETARATLDVLYDRFPNAARVFLGNLPDRERLDNFFADRYVPGIENEHESPIGMWRTQDAFSELAALHGWNAAFRAMPSNFYAAHYRYDAILTRSD